MAHWFKKNHDDRESCLNYIKGRETFQKYLNAKERKERQSEKERKMPDTY
jgi:hypothetical protein